MKDTERIQSSFGGISMSKKWTGRLLATAFCVLTAAASCMPGFAAGSQMVVKECDNLQLTLPDDMSAVTRSSEISDPYFKQHHLSYDAVMRDFRDGDSYLQAMDPEGSVTLTLSYLDTDAQDFNEMSDEDIAEMGRSFLGGTDAVVQYSACTPDQADSGLVWLLLDMNAMDMSGTVSRQYQATTVYSGKNITLTLCRNNGSVTANDYAALAGVANSVKANRVFPWRRLIPIAIVVGSVILLIILIKVGLRIAKSLKESGKLSKKSENDKILEELFGKYHLRSKGGAHADTSKDDAPAPKRLQRKDLSADKTKPAETEDKSEYVDIYAHSSARKEAEDARKKEAAAAAEPEKKAESAKEERPIPEKPELKRPDSEKTEDKKSSEDRLSRYLNDDDFDTNDDSDTPVRKYSDEDIERLLAETEGR